MKKSGKTVELSYLRIRGRAYKHDDMWTFFVRFGEKDLGETFHCPHFFKNEKDALRDMESLAKDLMADMQKRTPGLLFDVRNWFSKGGE